MQGVRAALQVASAPGAQLGCWPAALHECDGRAQVVPGVQGLVSPPNIRMTLLMAFLECACGL